MQQQRAVKPLNYVLFFEPDLGKFTFTGRESVSCEAAKPTDKIVMNAADLAVSSCRVLAKGKEVPCKFSLDAKREELSISLKRKVSGKLEVQVEFAGILNDRLAGFYRSSYTEKGRQKFLATTQFEADDARRAFPCWDEPSAKATFDVSILAGPGMTAISNTNCVSKKKSGGKTLFKFARTPIMSTYLVYLGVGEFEFLEDRVGKVSMRVVTTRGKSQQGEMALGMAKKFLKYYEDYFGVPYPLPKLDLIAVPDFASGAMENWGAITFRETALLYDKATSSTATMHRIAEVVAHEIAHQWFGNLVTMRWWNDLWLNESFATFMATKCVDRFHPEWYFWDQFVLESVNEGMSLDALKSSHPIEVEIKRPSQIREIFDDISYDKGGSVLRMLEDWLGEDAFRDGLRIYMREHKYSNTATDDLWASLSKSSSKPVKEMMDTWIRQVGYPVIDVEKKGGGALLTQRRFLLEGRGTGKERWVIPLTAQTSDRLVQRTMSDKAASIPLDGGWIKLNMGQKGFYRVRYDSKFLEPLKKMVREKQLSKLDRWGLQSDMFSLCISGQIGVKEYLDFASVYEDEDDFVVLEELAGCMFSIYLLTSGERFSDEIRQVCLRFFRRLLSRLGWDSVPGEKETDKLLRPVVISCLARLDDGDVLAEGGRRFAAFLKDQSSLDPEIRTAVYGIAAWTGDVGAQDLIMGLYRKAGTQEEKVRFLANVTWFQDERLVLRGLDFSLTKDVRNQDMIFPFARAEGNPAARKLLWPWLKKNWKEIYGRFSGLGIPLLKRFVESVAILADEKREKEVRDFFKRSGAEGLDMVLDQTMERMRVRSAFLQRARKEFS